MGGPVVYKGKTYPHLNALSDAEAVVANSTVDGRLKSGWSLEKALKAPAQKQARPNPITTFEGKTYPTFKALCKAEGVVSHNTVESRLRNGWTLEKALKTPARMRSLSNPVPVYKRKTYETRKALFEAEGVASLGTVDSRLRMGWPLEKALKKPVKVQAPKRPKKNKYHGKTYETLSALVQAEGKVPYAVVNSRLRLGWNLHDALKTPKEGRNKRVFKVDGKTYKTISALAKAFNLPYTTVMSRVRQGHSDHEIAYGGRERNANRIVKGHTTVVAGKSFPSESAAAKYFEISSTTFSKRLRRGYTPEQAAELQEAPRSSKGPVGPGAGTRVVIKGRSFESLWVAAAHFGESYYRAVARMQDHGATVEQALGLEPYSTAYTVKFRGKKYESKKALAEAHGLEYSVVRGRLRLGWKLEEALGLVDRPISHLNKGQYNQKFFDRNPAEKDVSAVLYFVNIVHQASGKSFSKIGITAHTLEGRLAKHAGYTYDEITSKETTLYDAWLLEQMILEDYADRGIIWQETDFGGRTECFVFSDEQVDEIRQLIDEL